MEYAINDFATKQWKVFKTENGQMEDYWWCVHCNRGYISVYFEIIASQDIYNNEYVLLGNACSLDDEEKVEQACEERINDRMYEEELEGKQDDEERRLEEGLGDDY